MTLIKSVAAIRSLLQKRGSAHAGKSGYSVQFAVKSAQYGEKGRSRLSWLKDVKKMVPAAPLFNRKGLFVCRAEKRKIMVQRALKVVAIVAMVLLTAVGLKRPVENFVASIELFRIKDVAISGCRITRPDEIRALAGLDFNSHIFSLHPGGIAAAIMADPWIKEAKVRRLWPDRLGIEVVEHRVRALFTVGTAEGDILYYINDKGERIAPVQPGQDKDYPVITGIDTLPEESRPPALEDAMLFLRMVAGNDPSLPLQSVSELHFNGDHGMVVHLVEFPFPIYFGNGEIKKKYRQLRRVLAVLYKSRTQNIDIGQVEYIRMDYQNNKVLVARQNQVKGNG